MHRPPSFLLTGLPLVALALLLGCPSKSGGQHLEQPMLAPPLASLPALKPVLPAPVQKSLASLAAPPKSRTAQVFRKPAALLATAVGAPAPQHLAPQAPVSAPVSQAAAPPSGPVPATPAPPVVPLPAVPSPLSDRAQTAPAATKAALHEAKAKASSRRLVASYGAQLALVFPTNGGLRLAAGGPSVALGLNTVWRLPKGLRLRPRLDYTVFTGETRTSTAAPLPQTLNTRVSSLALGGTAVGSGVNCHPEFPARTIARINVLTGLSCTVSPSFYKSLSSLETAVEISGHLRTCAIALIKIANDLRWMNSGPLAGLGEISLPALQPGSSIMPAKVNPVIPEAVCMAGAQVIGNDTVVALAAQAGNFQLNTMLPLAAANLLDSIDLLAGAAVSLAEKAIAGMKVNREVCSEAVARNPILVTALNPKIGYLAAAKIAKKAMAENRPILDIALEETDLTRSELSALLDPTTLADGGKK